MSLSTNNVTATYNEKLLLSNGLSVSPISGPGGESSAQPRSLRQAVSSINSDKDLNDYITSQHRNMQHHAGEIKYERNPVSFNCAPLRVYGYSYIFRFWHLKRPP